MRRHDKDPVDAHCGEHGLIVALLRQVVVDARDHGRYAPEAVAFLRDPEQVRYWCDLVGLECDSVQQQLLHAAGLE